MKLIPLTQGKLAQVDDADYEFLSQWKWQARNSYGIYYASRACWVNGKTQHVIMHRALLNAPPSCDVDHKDGNGLNNQRSNLRLATASQNNCNRGPQSNSTSGCKGVSWHPRKNRWRARIRANNKDKFIGYFDSKEEAFMRYQIAALELHGEFARVVPFDQFCGTNPLCVETNSAIGAINGI